MYLKHKIHIYLFCVVIASSSGYSASFMERMRDWASIQLSPSLLDSVNESIVGKIKAKNIKVVLPNKVEIDELDVLDEHGARVLYGKKVRLTISILSLLTNNVRITNAYVDAPFFHYTVIKNVHNVVRMFESKSPSKKAESKSKFRVTIDAVKVENGSYEMYHDAGVEIFADNISAHGSFWVEKGPFGVDIRQANITHGAILAAGMDLPITDLVAKNLWISDERVSVKDLVAKYEQSRITGVGSVFIAEERYDVAATIDAPAETYPKGLKPLPFKAPPFKGSIKMTGSLTEPEILADIDFAGTDFNGLKIKRGHAITQINRHHVMVDKALLRVGEAGVIYGNGTIDIDKGNYVFETSQKDIRASELATFLSFEEKTDGVIEGSTKAYGSFAHADQNVHLVSQGVVRNGKINEVVLADQTNFDVDINVVLEKNITITRAKLSDKDGLRLALSGFGSLIDKSVKLNFDLITKKAHDYLPRFKPHEIISGLSAHGSVAIQKDSVTLFAPVRIGEVTMNGFNATQIVGNIQLEKNKLIASGISASLYGGTAYGNLTIDDLKRKRLITGDAVLRSVDLEQPAKRFAPLPLRGIIHSSLKISGSLQEPTVGGSIEAEDLVVDRVTVRAAQAEGQFSRDRVAIARISLLPESGNIEGSNISFDVKTRAIGGAFAINDVDLSSALTGYVSGIDGDLSGPVHVEGTLDAPMAIAPLVATNLSLHGVKLGTGAVTVGLARRPLLGRGNLEDLVLSISTNLEGQGAKSVAQFSYALNKKSINTDISFDNLELDTTVLGAENKIFGMTGKFRGKITAEGPLDAPVFYANILSREYSFFDSRVRPEAISTKKTLGPAELIAHSKQGKLHASLCVSLKESGAIKCDDDNAAIRFSATGPFSLDRYSLAIKGSVNHDHFEDVFFAMKKELMTLDLSATIKGHLEKKIGAEPKYSAFVSLDKLNASLPNIPKISLEQPVSLAISPKEVELDGNAKLVFSPGTLTINGSYSPSDIDLHAEGDIPLVLSRLFLPLVQRADGLASGEIALTGSPHSPIVEGDISFQKGATIILRKWLEPIEVRGGKLSFTRTSSTSFRTKLQDIKLSVGDGRVVFDGSFEKQYRNDISHRPSTFDIKVQGSNIVVRDRLNFVETDFEIATQQTATGTSTATGKIVITDGSAHRQFDLRNFIAQAETASATNVKFLEGLDLSVNLDIVVRQFRASARMLNLDIESILRGQMTATGPIARPKFKGSLVVSEGTIIFPYKSFDIVENQIELNENSAKPFDPKINIVATQELESKDFPVLNEDTTIQLSLRGDLDRLSLELQPIRGDRRLSQLKIFMLLLSPRLVADEGSDLDNLRQGAQNAAMALSGEVFLRPLTNELAELLEGKTRTRIQFGSAIEPGGVSLRMVWKLGPRIELQGSYLFLSHEAQMRADTSKTELKDTSYTLGDLKLKLLLFDHRPWGPLSFESSFGSIRLREGTEEPRGKVRLKYRVLTK